MTVYDFSQSFAGLNQGIEALGRGIAQARRRSRLSELGKSLTGPNPDYNAAAQGFFDEGDTDTALKILTYGQTLKKQGLSEAASRDLSDAIGGMYGGGGAAAPSTARAQSLAPLGQPNDVENTFVNTVRGAGLTNPVGLGAVAAYGNAESKYSPRNVGRTWSDPSESGVAGTSGGIMSWRDDRLLNLQRFAASRGEQGNGSPQTQALFLAQEDPTLITKLQAARTPAEANELMARAWRFAGYNREGGENARRLALTQQYADRYAQSDRPAPGATNAALETGAPGFTVPGQPSMSGRTFDAVTAGQPLDPVFMSEGTSQPWMGSALANLGRTGSPTSRPAELMPPPRPYDLRADQPAQGSVPAIGQMPPIDRAGAVDIDPNSNDAGVLRGLVASEEARRGLPSGASVTSFLDNFRSQQPGQPAPRPQVSTNGGSSVPAPGARADLPAAGAAPTEGRMPVLSKDMPRPTNVQEYREYGETRNMENRRGQIGKLAAALSNPNLPTNAREVGQIFLREALEQSKAPDSVKEFMYARGMGWTTAKNPSEYAAEKEKAKKLDASETVDDRKAAAANAGLKPGDAGYQSYILTGKMPREDMGPLSATDKKAIMEADDAVQSAQTAIKSLQDAKKLSPQALGGWGASAKAAIANNLWDGIVPDRLVGSPQQGQATAELDNVVTSQALAQLKSIFGAAPTEGERKILLDIQGSIGQPDNVRQKVFDRGIELAQRRLEFNRQRAAELRGGDYYKSPEKRLQGGNSEPQGSAPVPGARQAGDGNWYVPDPNRQGKYLRVN